MSGARCKTDETTVVLVGDAGTGKTTLIQTLVHGAFSEERLPRTLQPLSIPPELVNSTATLTVVDSSSAEEQRSSTVKQLFSADVVLLVCSFDQPESMRRVQSYWFDLFDSVALTVPVVVVVNKSDLAPAIMDSSVPSLVNNPRIEAYIECSARTFDFIRETFALAHHTSVYPVRPLYDTMTRRLKPKYVKALNRVFRLFDSDYRNLLTDAQIADYLEIGFGSRLKPSYVTGVKRVVAQQAAHSVHREGITFEGFLYLNRNLIEKRKADKAWGVLAHFGYDGELDLREDYVPVPRAVAQRRPDANCELRPEAVAFLTRVFLKYDVDGDGALSNQPRSREADEVTRTGRVPTWRARSELEDAFYPCPVIPLLPNFTDYIETKTVKSAEHMNLNGWLSHWSMLALFAPEDTLSNLVHVGMPVERLESALHVNPGKADEEGCDVLTRRSVYCVVVGARGSGKTSLLRGLARKPFRDAYVPTDEVMTVAGYVPANDRDAELLHAADGEENDGHFLIMKEVPESDILSEANLFELKTCDLVALVYDGADPTSFAYVDRLVPLLAEDHIPMVLVHSKADLHRYDSEEHYEGTEASRAELASQEVSLKFDCNMDIYRNFVLAALNPGVTRPHTERKRRRAQMWTYMTTAAGLLTASAAAFFAYRWFAGGSDDAKDKPQDGAR